MECLTLVHNNFPSDSKSLTFFSLFYCSGSYLFSEASWPRKKGDKARLASGFIDGLSQGRSSCRLRFYFHMFGDHIGSLNVYTRPCNGCVETNVYSRSGNVGNFWDRAEVILQSTVPFQVWRLSIIVYFSNTIIFINWSETITMMVVWISVLNSIDMFLWFNYSIYSPGLASIEKIIYQTLETVFHPISKHLQFHQKILSAMHHSFKYLLSVWWWWNTVSRVWYVTFTAKSLSFEEAGESNPKHIFHCRQSSYRTFQETEVDFNSFKRSRPWVVIGRF